MFKKAMVVLIPLATAAGPVALFSGSEWWSKTTALLSSDASEDSQAALGTTFAGSGTDGAPGAEPASMAAAGQTPIGHLGDVFRFDIKPGWIVARWPRVSTGLGQLQLQGYRVPLVTGTRQDDLAGALTYYFSPEQQVERITFQGTTGDVRRLIQFLAAHYRFGRRVANDPGLVVYEMPERNGTTDGQLRIRTSGVVKSDQRYTRYQVALRIDRPQR
jgi:hypothetical protein